MGRRRLLTLALLALMLPGLVLARGAALSLCLCGGPIGALTHLVDPGGCCESEEGGCCGDDAEAWSPPAPCCGAGEPRGSDGGEAPTVERLPCGGCAELLVDGTELTFEPHASGERRGELGAGVYGAAPPRATVPLPRIALGAAAERGPPGPRDMTTPAALRRGDRPMRS